MWDKHRKLLDTLSLPITMKWNGITPQASRKPTPWVTQLITAHQHMTSQALRASASGSADGFDMFDILIPLMGWNIPFYSFCRFIC
jgi:hypothetical protein